MAKGCCQCGETLELSMHIGEFCCRNCLIILIISEWNKKVDEEDESDD